MSRDVQRFGPESGRGPAAPDRRTAARPIALGTRIGNRAMARLAAGEVPTGLAGGRVLQRDTPKDNKPDPKSGSWVKFQGKRSHGDWLPLGNFSLEMTKGSDDSTAFVDVLVDSAKGLHLGEALDNDEHLTVMMEQREPHGAPIRQSVTDAEVISVSRTNEIIPTGMDASGTRELTTSRAVVRVGLRLKSKARAAH